MLDYDRPKAFLATLGINPQVVTVTLDLLLQSPDLRFEEVVFFHTSPLGPRMRKSVRELTQELKSPQYRGRLGRVRPVPLPVNDVRGDEDADAVMNVIRDEILVQKRRHRSIYFNAAGARKGIMIFAMALAQILFDDQDHLWVLYSTEAFETRGDKHPSWKPDGTTRDARLIEIPVVPFGTFSPALGVIAGQQPREAIRRASESAEWKEHLEAARFWLEELNDTQRGIILAILSKTKQTSSGIGQQLHLSKKTVEKNLSVIYDLLRNCLGVPEKQLHFRRETEFTRRRGNKIVTRDMLIVTLFPFVLRERPRLTGLLRRFSPQERELVQMLVSDRTVTLDHIAQLPAFRGRDLAHEIRVLHSKAMPDVEFTRGTPSPEKMREQLVALFALLPEEPRAGAATSKGESRRR